MFETTVLEVEVSNKGNHIWVIKRCDHDLDLVDVPTASGTPAPAGELPLGTIFATLLFVPGMTER